MPLPTPLPAFPPRPPTRAELEDAILLNQFDRVAQFRRIVKTTLDLPPWMIDASERGL